mgnify:CR=1 FL=1
MNSGNIATAVFGGGCFWCTEAVFKILKGVISVAPGYAGGPSASSGQVPTYEQVCSGTTGHAEVIRIEYDPEIISYNDLLTVFFATHDPTTPNKQGNDIGTQYRSIILYTNEEQKKKADEFIADLNASHKEGSPIVTEVKPLGRFFEAEEYHKNYYARNAEQSYCQVVIHPKLKKVQEQFAKLLNQEK